MNKIKQNKVTFTLILSFLAIIFSSLIILSLPVLFNYKSKVTQIEKNFYKNFKFYLNSNGKISYKPFPKPHLLVENATLSLSSTINRDKLIKTTNLKIYISLRNIYLRSFKNLISTEISDSNLELKIEDIREFRNHLFQKINKPIILNDCKIFLKNNKNEVILISPVQNILYNINNKKRTKSFIVDGEVFGLKFRSNWNRNYNSPKTSNHTIQIIYPNIEIKNKSKFENLNEFSTKSQIFYSQDKMNYYLQFKNNKITISSPNKENTNFNINSDIIFKPFYFNGELTIKKKKVEQIIDNFLLNLLSYDENYLGNFNGKLKINLDNLNNKLIKGGSIDLIINEKKIIFKEAKFNLYKIGYIKSYMSHSFNQGELKFKTKNLLNIKDHVEFAKIFQVGSNKVKNINKIYFDVEKISGDSNFIISNVKINNDQNKENSNEIFLVKNIQNLRSYIRKIID